MFKLRIVKRGDSITIFNQKTGETVIDQRGDFDTPYLLDVSLTSKCDMSCPYCYKKADQHGTDMTMSDFDVLLDRMVEAKIFQVAYGGGNPNEHPHFIEILRRTREAGVVPNYSTNGRGMTDAVVQATAKYAGAVAVSLHKDFSSYKALIQRLTSAIPKVNLHVIMARDNIEAIINLLINPPFWMSRINAVILLRYKNAIVGCTREPDTAQYAKLFLAVEKCQLKIGFDACSYPLIRRFLPKASTSSYDYCQGSRSSAYVNEHLIMSPCSFDKHFESADDLHKKTIKEIFTQSYAFLERRKEISKYRICKQYFSDFEMND